MFIIFTKSEILNEKLSKTYSGKSKDTKNEKDYGKKIKRFLEFIQQNKSIKLINVFFLNALKCLDRETSSLDDFQQMIKSLCDFVNSNVKQLYNSSVKLIAKKITNDLNNEYVETYMLTKNEIKELNDAIELSKMYFESEINAYFKN